MNAHHSKRLEAVLALSCNGVTNYRVELPHDIVREFLKRAGRCNNILENISKIVGDILKANGKSDHIRILVGNEGSRVIYIDAYLTPGSPEIKQVLSDLSKIGYKREYHADKNDELVGLIIKSLDFPLFSASLYL